MAVLVAPLIDFDGSSGEPTSLAALVTQADIMPGGEVIYTGGILSAPQSQQLDAEQPVGYATSG